MGIVLGTMCFSVALLIVAGVGLALIRAKLFIPMTQFKAYKIIEKVLEGGLLVSLTLLVLTIAIFFVFAGLTAISCFE